MHRYRNNCASGKISALEVCDQRSAPVSIVVESPTSICGMPYKDGNPSTQLQQPQTPWE